MRTARDGTKTVNKCIWAKATFIYTFY